MKIGSAGKYILCVLLVLFFVSGAFWMPGIVMGILDRQTGKNYVFQNRTGVDYEAINLEYDLNRGSRLNSFAKGIASGNQYYIVAADTGKGISEKDLEEIYRSLDGQEMFWVLASFFEDDRMGELFEISRYELHAFGNYVIYGANAAGGETLLCRYLEFAYPNLGLLRIVMDAKDSTIYYMEAYSALSKEFYDAVSNSEDNEFGDMTVAARDGSSFIYLYHFLDDYYLAGEGTAQKVVNTFEELGYPIEEYEVFDRGMGRVKEVSNRFRWEDHKLLGDMEYKEGSLTCVISFATDYNEVHYRAGVDYPAVCIGIQEVADLLPQEIKGIPYWQGE